jgi:WD40 repeat protein
MEALLLILMDGTSNSWSAITMSESKYWMANIAAGNTIFWAGGLTGSLGTPSDKVEMYDVNTGNRTYHQLSKARLLFEALRKDNKILFYTGDNPLGSWINNVDIYDINTQSWSACIVSQPLKNTAIIAAEEMHMQQEEV